MGLCPPPRPQAGLWVAQPSCPQSLPHLINQHQRVLSPGLLQTLDNLPRHGPHVGPPVGRQCSVCQCAQYRPTANCHHSAHWETALAWTTQCSPVDSSWQQSAAMPIPLQLCSKMWVLVWLISQGQQAQHDPDTTYSHWPQGLWQSLSGSHGPGRLSAQEHTMQSRMTQLLSLLPNPECWDRK